MGTGELNESKHINKPVPGGTVIPQYPYIAASTHASFSRAYFESLSYCGE